MGVVQGALASWAPGESLRVTVGDDARPRVATSTVKLSGAELTALVAARASVILGLVDGDPERPVVLGLLQALPTSIEVELPLGVPEVAEVDGKRVRLVGRDEIELRCGQASITLRRNGRLVLRGTAVESASSGTHRIKGATVQIN